MEKKLCFWLLKCIRRYVQNGPLIILVLVWRKSIHFWRRWTENYFYIFVSSNLNVWPLDRRITPPFTNLMVISLQNINFLSCSNNIEWMKGTWGMWQTDRQIDRQIAQEIAHFCWWNVFHDMWKINEPIEYKLLSLLTKFSRPANLTTYISDLSSVYTQNPLLLYSWLGGR